MPQTRARKKPPVKEVKRPEAEAETQAPVATAVDVAGIDELLDEIDAVLEENVIEVLRSYVQKGGQ